MPDQQPRPRDLIQGSPEQFGFQPNARWKQPTTLEELVRLRHAEIQHEFAFRVRMHLREQGLSQARFIGVAKDEPDGANWFPKDHFGRGINGTARFTLDQLLKIEQHTGPILTRLKFPKTVLTNPGLIQAVPHTRTALTTTSIARCTGGLTRTQSPLGIRTSRHSLDPGRRRRWVGSTPLGVRISAIWRSHAAATTGRFGFSAGRAAAKAFQPPQHRERSRRWHT